MGLGDVHYPEGNGLSKGAAITDVPKTNRAYVRLIKRICYPTAAETDETRRRHIIQRDSDPMVHYVLVITSEVFITVIPVPNRYRNRSARRDVHQTGLD